MAVTSLEAGTLVTVLRQQPWLTPDDSVYRAVELLRRHDIDTLAVVDGYGELQGVVTMRDLRSLLEEKGSGSLLIAPISRWARMPDCVGHTEMSLDEVRRILADGDETTLIVLDTEGRYFGAVTLADLLVPTSLPPRPSLIGGMATPWGVYLTNGTIQAGTGNGALVASGILLGLLMTGSYVGAGGLAWVAQKVGGWPLFSLWNAAQPDHIALQNAGWFLLRGVSLILFLLLMRLIPLAGYHAAEHQAVHAMERGELLHPEIVRRMPRVHPRCGTNIMAAGLLFTVVSQGLPALGLGLDSMDGAIVGALVALFTWRKVGSFLQQYFTTRPASDRQLASGIAAAEDLERKFLHSAPLHPTLWRRLWCMGLFQTMVGVSLVVAVSQLLDWML